MTLTGWGFLTLTAVATVAAFVAVVVTWPLLARPGRARIVARAAALVGVNVLVLLTAATQLNAQYLFFADWTDLRGAVGGASTTSSVHRGAVAARAAGSPYTGDAATAGAVLPPLPPGASSGSGVLTYTVKGPLSGVAAHVVVQLPPGYTAPANASVRYPVLQTFTGYPATPRQWITTMGLGDAIAREVAARRMRPVLIVSPALEVPAGVDTECVNGRPGTPQLETWLTRDVPNWVAQTFRVQTDRGSWATIGLSTGGWCAAMAAMLHPAQYSAAVVMGGYFRPQFGPAYEPYPPASPLARRYNLVALARRPPPVAMWLQTSHSDRLSYGSSAAFIRAARPPLAVNAIVLRHAGHRISLWQGLLPDALTWLGANVPGFTGAP